MIRCGIIHEAISENEERDQFLLNSVEWGREEKEEEEEEWNARDAANSVNAAVCMSSLWISLKPGYSSPSPPQRKQFPDGHRNCFHTLLLPNVMKRM